MAVTYNPARMDITVQQARFDSSFYSIQEELAFERGEPLVSEEPPKPPQEVNLAAFDVLKGRGAAEPIYPSYQPLGRNEWSQRPHNEWRPYRPDEG